jgi:hypothetical protein
MQVRGEIRAGRPSKDLTNLARFLRRHWPQHANKSAGAVAAAAASK